MTAIADILNSLGGSRDGVVPSAEIFPLLDVEQISAHLRLVKRGEDDGEANLPPTNDSAESSAERDIGAEISRRAARAHRDYQAQLDLYDGRIKRAAIVADMRTSIEAAGEGALADFRVQAADDLSRLEPLKLEVRGREAELSNFRRVNGLDRLPRYEQYFTLRVAFLAFLVLFESLMNGLFFAQASEAGIIGGVSQAFILSLLNIFCGWTFANYGSRQFHHRRALRRLAGCLGLIAYVVVLVLLNLSIGHYRDLYVAHSGDVPPFALVQSVSQGPLHLASARSLLLVLVGMAFSLLAVLDVSGMGDPYPGYGRLGRRLREVVDHYGEQRTRCIADLQERRDAAVTEMTRVIESVRSKEHDIVLSVNGRARLHQQYVAFIEHLHASYTRLVQRYREANIRARTTPPPARFGSEPPPLSLLGPPPDLPDLAPDKEAMRHVIQRMEFFIREIRKEFEAQAGRYAAVSELLDAAQGSPDVSSLSV